MIKYYSLNGETLPSDQAQLHVTDLAITRGYGIFDFFRTSDGIPLFMDDHIRRFRHSAEKFQLEFNYDDEFIKTSISDLIAANGFEESGVKLILTGGYSANGFDPGTPNFVIMVDPLQFPDPTFYTDGVKLITLNHLREFPEVKSINYLTAVLTSKRCKEEGALDVLFHDGQWISEVTRSNFFMINGGRLITPSSGILRGITRKKILDLAANDMPVEERPVGLEEIYEADEVFITSSTKRLMPVVDIDGRVIGQGKPGSVTQRLYDQFYKFEKDFVHGRI